MTEQEARAAFRYQVQDYDGQWIASDRTFATPEEADRHGYVASNEGLHAWQVIDEHGNIVETEEP